MLKNLYPDEYLNGIDDIDLEMYAEQGIKGIITDVDNTIVPHGAPADEHAIEWFKKVRSYGIDTCIISNNDEPRVQPFADAVGSKYIYNAHKPSTKNYKRAMELMGTDTKSTLFVGDQIFTDIWGAKKTGLQTVMVKLIDKHEEIQIILKRIPERFIMWRWRKRLEKESLDK